MVHAGALNLHSGQLRRAACHRQAAFCITNMKKPALIVAHLGGLFLFAKAMSQQTVDK